MYQFTKAATAAFTVVACAGIASAQDCNANGIPDFKEISTAGNVIDFEEGNIADLTANGGGIGLVTSAGLNFTITNLCFAGSTDATTDGSCGPGNFVISLVNPANCDFDTGSRESGFFFFNIDIAADDDAILRFCSRYLGENGLFIGDYVPSAGQWVGNGFDIAGVSVYDAADLPLSTPLATLDVSGQGDSIEWGEQTLDLSGLAPGSYLVVFGFDSQDATANGTFGWQIDNIQVNRDAPNRDYDNNNLPDDCDFFVYNQADDELFFGLAAALDSPNFDPFDPILATPSVLAGFNQLPRDIQALNLASIPAPLGSTSLAQDFIIPVGGVLELTDGNILDNQAFGSWFADGGEFRVAPGSLVEIQDPLDIINNGTLTINSSATLTTSTSTDIISGTLNLLGGTADLGSGLDIGTFSGDPAVAQGFGTYTNNVDINNSGQMLVQANTQIINGIDISAGGNVTIQNGTLTVFGTINNNGTIIGDAVTPIDGRLHDAGARNTAPGVTAIGDLTLGANASLLTPNPDFVLKVSGNLNIQTPVGPNIDLAQSELRLIGTTTQTFEALAIDLGPDAAGLDPALPGNEPIGTLRVGPTPTTATIVDNNNNAAAGTEVLYVSNLVIEASATLDATNAIIYYENLINNGTIITPANVIPIDIVVVCAGNTNGDGAVDLSDLLTVLGNFGTATANGPADGDVAPVGSPNGFVDLSDLLTVLGNFGNPCP